MDYNYINQCVKVILLFTICDGIAIAMPLEYIEITRNLELKHERKTGAGG